MPAGRAARPCPPPFQPGRAATSGRAGARPAAPSRAPDPAECVAASAGDYFEREGSGPASVFSAFSWPPARQPGPSAARGVGGGVVTWRVEGEGLRDPAGAGARARAREAPGGGPDLRSLPRPSRGIINSAPGSAATPGRPLPARPSSGEHGRPGHSLPRGGLGPHWIAPLCTSGQSPASISLPVNWGRATWLYMVGTRGFACCVPLLRRNLFPSGGLSFSVYKMRGSERTLSRGRISYT